MCGILFGTFEKRCIGGHGGLCFAKTDVASVTLREGTEDRGLVEVRLASGLLYSFDCLKRDTLELFAALSGLLN